MREDRPSATAMLVALARGVAPGRRDAHASALLPRPLGGVGALAADRPLARGLLRGVTLGLVDHIALRTAALDAVVEEGRERSIPQLVLLGAGLDARAWRFGAHGYQVYEVDHPATQTFKRRHAPKGAAPIYVPVRFGDERVADALEAAGHRADQPTVWLWEGVTMYLPEDAVEDTLGQVRERSAPGSLLGVTYIEPGGIHAAPGIRTMVDWVFEGLGEGLGARYRPDALRRLVSRHGFVVRRDGGSETWPRLWGGEPRMAQLVLGAERLCVAECAGADSD